MRIDSGHTFPLDRGDFQLEFFMPLSSRLAVDLYLSKSWLEFLAPSAGARYTLLGRRAAGEAMDKSIKFSTDPKFTHKQSMSL